MNLVIQCSPSEYSRNVRHRHQGCESLILAHCKDELLRSWGWWKCCCYQVCLAGRLLNVCNHLLSFLCVVIHCLRWFWLETWQLLKDRDSQRSRTSSTDFGITTEPKEQPQKTHWKWLYDAIRSPLLDFWSRPFVELFCCLILVTFGRTRNAPLADPA